MSSSSCSPVCVASRKTSSAAASTIFDDRRRRHALGAAHELVEVDVRRGRAVVELGLEDRAAGLRVGQVDPDVAVEAAGPDHRGVEVLDRVRRGHDEQLALVAVRLERGQQLVDRAPRLLVGGVVAALRDRVELVEEEQARQVAGAPSGTPCRCSAPSRPTSELTRSPVETWMRFSPYSPAIAAREERLADARRAVQQDPVPLDAVALGVVGVLEHQADGVAHLLLERLHAADVVERRQLLGRLHLEVAPLTTRPPAGCSTEQRASGLAGADARGLARWRAARPGPAGCERVSRSFSPGGAPRSGTGSGSTSLISTHSPVRGSYAYERVHAPSIICSNSEPNGIPANGDTPPPCSPRSRASRSACSCCRRRRRREARPIALAIEMNTMDQRTGTAG